MIKSIMAVADAGPLLEPMLSTAGFLAERMGAELDAVHIRDAAPMIAGMPDAAVVSHSLDIENWVIRRAGEARAVFGKVLQGTKASWLEESGPEIGLLTQYARTSDLTVVMRPGSDPEKTSPGYVRPLLFESARPVVVAPPLPRRKLESAVVAWNGTQQSARAIGYALPFLQRASSVTIVTLAAQGHRPSADALVRYLARHQIKPYVESYDPGSVSARARGRSLLTYVDSKQADFLVMGAYGEGRLMQFLGLGGATAKVITGCKVPVLLAC